MNEQEKRIDTFDAANSVAVVFADGQAWFVPKPWIVIRPQFKGGVAVNAYRFLTYSENLDTLVEAISMADGDGDQVVGVATLAAYLLRYNYDLSDDELDQLLAFRVGDPASLAWVGQVVETATGRNGPKVVRAGGG